MSFTRNDIRDAVAERLGQRTDLDTAIELEIRYAQRQLEEERSLPWFLLTRRVSVSTVASTQAVSVPTRFLREYDEAGQKGSVEIQDDDGNWHELRKLPIGDLDAEFGNTDEARPEAYALIGQEFLLGPIPNAIYTLRIRTFYQGATDLTSDVSNDWTIYGPDLLIAATGKRMAHGYLRDEGAKAQFDLMYAEAHQRLVAENTAREESGTVRILNETYP